MANKVASLSDLSIVENYIKNVHFVDANNIQSAYLPKSKSYLKILSISYLIEDTNMPIDASVIKTIIRFIYIFNNIYITFKLWAIKVSFKFDIAIIWTDI